MPSTPYIDLARRAFDAIHAACPSLRFEETPSGHVDVNIDLPIQDGLAYAVNLSLQGDELHFSVERGFWMEWFPCYDEAVASQFVEAVVGFLSGRYRIIEVSQGNHPFVARLQRPSGSSWQTIATSRSLRVPWPWRRSTRILQNGPGIAA